MSKDELDGIKPIKTNWIMPESEKKERFEKILNATYENLKKKHKNGGLEN